MTVTTVHLPQIFICCRCTLTCMVSGLQTCPDNVDQLVRKILQVKEGLHTNHVPGSRELFDPSDYIFRGAHLGPVNISLSGIMRHKNRAVTGYQRTKRMRPPVFLRA